jgi:hypothetical protein
MSTEWRYRNNTLELHDEQGLLCSWPADAAKDCFLASLLNHFPAIGRQMAQLMWPMLTEQCANQPLCRLAIAACDSVLGSNQRAIEPELSEAV